jgi:hypothetical protein
VPHSLQPVYDMEDLAARFNELPEARAWKERYGSEKYNRWKVKRILDAAGARCFQERRGRRGKKGTKFYITHGALAAALGGELLNSLLDVEALTVPEPQE